MKKLSIFVNFCSFLLAATAVFLGFAPLAASYTTTVLGNPITTEIKDAKSLFASFKNNEKLQGVGIAIVVLLCIAAAIAVILFLKDVLTKSKKGKKGKNKGDLSWLLNALSMLCLITAGILYFMIPVITKGALDLGSIGKIDGAINLAFGPILAAIFALVAGVFNLIPTIAGILKK